jgi:hypothetical protein
MWASGTREEALAQLREFNARLTQLVNQPTIPGQDAGHGANNTHTAIANGASLSMSKRNGLAGGDPLVITNMKHLLSRCYLKQGAWQMALQDEWNEVCNINIIY